MAESRTYRILGVVGTGGFGKVYRARLESGSGFSKDVAVKVLHDRDPDPDLLSRFRDEARILALIRDRAIVSVDPPTRLSGHWAVVMDFVDGQSAAALMTELGTFPPGVAVEITGEIARVLDKCFHFRGPDGEPLELLHRDIKPANIQITPTGEVRLLDFGVARASFAGREAHTTRSIGGTPGYMAPERLQGIEGPEGDVYSLGVVLWRLLTGEQPGDSRAMDLDDRARELAGEDEGLREALLLASRMRRLDETERPSMRDVERRCRDLRQALPEPWLRDWAEQVPEKSLEKDELAGHHLSETLFRMTTSGDMDTEPTRVRRTLLLGTGLMGFSFIGVVGAIGVGLLAIAVGLLALGTGSTSSPRPPPPVVPFAGPASVGSTDGPSDAIEPDAADPEGDPDGTDPDGTAEADPDAEVDPDATEVDPAVPEPAAEPTGAEPDAEPAAAEPDAEPAAAEPDAEPDPAPTPAQAPRPAPSLVRSRVHPDEAPAPAQPAAAPSPRPDPAPVPTPDANTVALTFRSVPWGARVYVDGADLGPSPVMGHPLAPGTHRVRMVLGDKTIEKSIRVGDRHPDSYRWAVDDGDAGWKASFSR